HALCNSFVDYRGHIMGAKIESDMRAELFEHYQKLSFSYYDNQRTGQLMSRLTNDLFSLSEFCHHGPEDLAIALLKLIGTLIILIVLNGTLTIALLLFLPLMVAHAFYFNRRMNAALQISRQRIGDINAQVEDTLSGIRVVKSFTNEAIENQKFAHENQRFVASRSDGYRSEMYYDTGMIAFTQLMTIGVIIFGGVGIARGSLDLADLLTYLMCVGILVEPIQRLVNFARLYQEGITGFNRLMEILEVEPEIQDAPNALELEHVQGHICFDRVSFKYHEDFDYVLKNISLDIQVGDYVALVGTSGVGKTTLCSLIPRFYEVTDGAILLDGRDIRQISLRSLRRNIG
ncbi:MAG: ABC transporter ATP-binding protein, partial [Anaerolineae bacterium]